VTSAQASGLANLICPVCAEPRVSQFRRGLYRCVTCTAVLSPAIWKDGADVRLERQWFDDGAYDPEGSYWTRLFEEWNARRTWRRLEQVGTTSGRLLEVGVGSGSLLAFMADRGFEVQGCDMSRDVCVRVESTRGFPMHCGPLTDLSTSASFDAVVMNHVVEHVSDPVSLLAQAERLLTPHGVLHIAVPNVGSWEANLSGWTSYLPYHLVYFNRPSLERAVGRAGLRSLRTFTYEPFSGWFLALLRTLTQRGRATDEPVTAGPSRKKSRLLEYPYRLAMLTAGGITWPLRQIQDVMEKGEELILLARSQRANN